MADRNFLAFDLGAESGRAVLGRLSNGKLTLEEKHRFPNPNGRINGHLHWNLLGQWEELKTGLRKTIQAGDANLHGIGVDTWGVDFGLVANDGEILGNPYHYRDTRTDGVMAKTFELVPKGKIFQATGIQFMEINSLFQLISMQLADSPILKCAQTLLFVPDLFNYLFTGVRKCEFSIASTSQMYDPRKKDWAREMLGQLDLPARLLPEVVPSGTILGPLREDVAAECGAGNIPVIAPATHDTASAVAVSCVAGAITGIFPAPHSAATSSRNAPRMVPDGTTSGNSRAGRSSCPSISRAQSFLRGSYIWLVLAIENSLLRIPVNK